MGKDQDGPIHSAKSRSESAKGIPCHFGERSRAHRILAAIESSSWAMQAQIAAIAVDVNLLRADLRVVAERSVDTEQKVTCVQSDVDILKTLVATLEAQTRKLEARVEDAGVGRGAVNSV
ncbi:hypothetical protein NDU88_001494 [Pleurodeles waltl]|uniref:Uncharacterized protein n=1 Tax=Pleurodeles waltl TaxID=8319 RepID=A0AAV7P3X4_PLEWA|nr:hypothetical protein NDU88_001494 [Pleurodeles waltl]